MTGSGWIESDSLLNQIGWGTDDGALSWKWANGLIRQTNELRP